MNNITNTRRSENMNGNTQHMRLFKKSTSKSIDCWTSVTAKIGDRFVSASMDIAFSQAAGAKFEQLCKESKTKGTDWVDAEVLSSWLKPEVKADGTVKMVLFINDFRTWQADKV